MKIFEFFKFSVSSLFVRNPRLAQIHGCGGGVTARGIGATSKKSSLRPSPNLFKQGATGPVLLLIWLFYRFQNRSCNPSSRMRHSMWGVLTASRSSSLLIRPRNICDRSGGNRKSKFCRRMAKPKFIEIKYIPY